MRRRATTTGRGARRWATILLLGCVSAAAAADERGAAAWCFAIDIDRVGPHTLGELKDTPGVHWWLELDRVLFACGDPATAEELRRRQRLLRLWQGIDRDDLALALGLSPAQLYGAGASILLRGGRVHLVSLDDRARARLRGVTGEPGGGLRPVAANTVVVSQLANRQSGGTAAAAKASVGELVDEVDADRWFAGLSALAAYHRSTFGTGILLARDWLQQQLQELGLSVTTPDFQVYGTTAYNVIATLPGSSRADDWYIVGGHYDAVSELPGVAPGAEDNASGCAGVLELARIFTTHPPQGTMLFICYSGEEQGLWGSSDHVDELLLGGNGNKVKAMVNMDMIGYTGDAQLDCLLESNASGQWLIDALAAAATSYTTLDISVSLNPYGSDHIPYLDEGMPAVLTIENDYIVYPHYHQSTDTPDKIVLEMGRQILRMNVAALADLVGAVDAELIFADGFESSGVTAWAAVVQ